MSKIYFTRCRDQTLPVCLCFYVEKKLKTGGFWGSRILKIFQKSFLARNRRKKRGVFWPFSAFFAWFFVEEKYAFLGGVEIWAFWPFFMIFLLKKVYFPKHTAFSTVVWALSYKSQMEIFKVVHGAMAVSACRKPHRCLLEGSFSTFWSFFSKKIENHADLSLFRVFMIKCK